MPENRLGNPVTPSIVAQGEALVREQVNNSVNVGAGASTEKTEASVTVKAGGDKWSVFAWAQWAKDRLTGRSGSSVGVGGQIRWLHRKNRP